MRNYFERKDAITFEEAIKRTIDKHGDKISLIGFNGAHHKSLFKCNICEKTWMADSWSVWSGNGCCFCYEKNRGNSLKIGIEKAKIYIESCNCSLLSVEYKNNKTPLLIQFECGHIANVSFDSFKRGSRCKICQLEKFKVSRKYSMERINKIMDENNLKFISFPEGYTNRSSIIQFSCNKYNHINNVTFGSFLRKNECYVCSRIELIEKISGVNASNWQGGLTELRAYLSGRISNWRNKSIEASEGKCIISGLPYDGVHHVYSFNLIMQESIAELGFELKEKIGDYNPNDIKILVKKIQEIHKIYPLGACLTSMWHKKFHDTYGYGDTTPEMWYEFLDRVKSGEIMLPE
jgi:hypothetical protein